MGAENINNEHSFLEHLEHLRWHLVRSVLIIVLLSVIAFVFKSFLFDKVLFAPATPNFFTYELYCWFVTQIKGNQDLCINQFDFKLINIKMSGQFMLHIKGAFMAGFIMGFPYLVFELLRFAFPGLEETEKSKILITTTVSTILFVLGVLFGYFILTPMSIQFLGNYSVSEAVENTITMSSFISTIMLIVLSAGITFQLPLIIYFLAKLDMVSSVVLKKYSKHAFVLILVLSAIITPPDIASQVFLTVPIFLLYYMSIYIAKRIEKK